jgi:selenocysteine lyase/cysteine desulfurase
LTEEQSVDEIHARESRLTQRLLAGLSDTKGVTLYGPSEPEDRLGVASFSVDGLDPQEVATLLDAGHRVQARAGFHCAPRMHQALGSAELGGTVRLSLGWATTEADIDATIDAVAQAAAVPISPVSSPT